MRKRIDCKLDEVGLKVVSAIASEYYGKIVEHHKTYIVIEFETQEQLDEFMDAFTG